MKNSLAQIIEEQRDIITAQAEIISTLSLLILQHISADELEEILKQNN